MTNEERLEKIEKLSSEMGAIKKAIDACRQVSKSHNAFAQSLFLNGLADFLEEMDSKRCSIWCESYDAHREYEKIQAKKEEEAGNAETV